MTHAAGRPAVQSGQYLAVSSQIRLHYASCGQPDRPLMLFIHGFPEFWYGWNELLPYFGEDWFAVAPDLRGFNLSSKPVELADYRAPAVMGDLVTLIERLGHGRAVVVAHDWGGAIGWMLAHARPDLVERLVILNAPHAVPFARALVNDPEQRASSQYMNWLRQPGTEDLLAENGFERLEAFFRKGGGGAWYTPEVQAAYHAAWSQPGALKGGCNYYRASPLHPPQEGSPGAGRLQLNPEDFRVKVPTLVLWGEEDAALRPVLLEGLDDLVSPLQVVRLPGATHWLVHEMPERIAGHIRNFLGGRAGA